MSRKERQSNMELLRVVAILLIAMMHAAGYVGTDGCEANRVAVTLINAVGNMGVTVFVLISGFFGIRFRWSGVLRLWLVMLFYAVAIAVYKVAAGEAVADFSLVVKALTPVTSQTWWFMTCYVMLYFLAPFINRAAQLLPRRQMETLMAILVFFFILSPSLLLHELTNDMHGKGLPNMITAYLIGQYLARYGAPELVERHCGKLLLAIVAALVMLTLFVANIFCRDNNVLVVAGAVCLFCWMRKHPFQATWVNSLATYVFPFYLVNGTALGVLSAQFKAVAATVAVWPLYLMVLAEVVALTAVVETLRRWLMEKPTARLTEKIDTLLYI